MPKNWKTYKLGEIGKVQTGPFGSQLHQKDYVLGGTPLVTVKNLGEKNINRNNLDGVSDEDVKRLKKYILRKGDIVFSRVGMNIDRSSLVTEAEDGWVFSSSTLMARLIEDKVHSEFLIYALNTETFKNYIRTVAVGATRPSLNTAILSNAEVTLPPLPEQKAIANILSAIDNKIENNLAINKTLEDMAMTLYKHWFVDFGPFQDEEFIESEIFGINENIKIPKSFKIISVKESIKRLKQKNKYNQKNVLKKGRIRVFDQSTDRILGFHNNEPDFNADFESPILIFGDHTCRFEIVCEDFSVGPNLIPFKPNNESYNFIMYLGLKEKVKTNDYKRHWSELMLHQLVVPSDEQILNKFNDAVQESFSSINQNEFENLYLTQLRDTLLPKLISGEVRLKEFQNQIETVL